MTVEAERWMATGDLYVEESNRRRFNTPAEVRAFMLAGNARLTLVSVKTGQRYTFKIKLAPGSAANKPWFVSVLTGQDNEASYTFVGCIWKKTLSGGNFYHEYQHGSKSKITHAAPSAKAFAWFFTQLFDIGHIPDQLEVWHEGTCGRCGRALTVPESIARGIGPECFAKGA